MAPPSGALPPLNAAAFPKQAGPSVFCQYWARDSVATGGLLSDADGRQLLQPRLVAGLTPLDAAIYYLRIYLS